MSSQVFVVLISLSLSGLSANYAVIPIQKNHFQLWSNMYCRSSFVHAKMEIYDTKSISACAILCAENFQICNGFSFEGDLCVIYERPRISAFLICDNKLATFYIWNEYTKTDADYAAIRNVAYLKSTYMSTTYSEVVGEKVGRVYCHANLSVDGIYNPQMFLNATIPQCAATNADQFPWWKVDLVDSFVVYELVIVQDNNYLAQLHDLEIRVGMTDIFLLEVKKKFRKLSENHLCAEYKGLVITENGKIHLRCSYDVTGRFVTIQVAEACISCGVGNHLTLCEVMVYGSPLGTKSNINRAYLQPVTHLHQFHHSSIPTDGADYPILNVKDFVHFTKDFVIQHNSRPKNCSILCVIINDSLAIGCENEEITRTSPSIVIDMWNNFIIEEIAIHVMQLTTSIDWQYDVDIRIGKIKFQPTIGVNTSNDTNPSCIVLQKQHFSGIFAVRCTQPVPGRYVALHVVKTFYKGKETTQRSFNFMGISEIIVIGMRSPADLISETIALYKPAHQSSESPSASAELAVNGYNKFDQILLEPTCSRTHDDDRLPWWRVDLLNDYAVSAVIIHNLENDDYRRLHDMEIRVGFFRIEHRHIYSIFTKNQLCFSVKDKNNTFIQKGYNRFDCDYSIRGRFVSIQITKLCSKKFCPVEYFENTLTLCEVEVLGQLLTGMYTEDYIQNIALHVRTRQSSTWFREVDSFIANDETWYPNWKIANGIYGCTHTTPESSDTLPWLEVIFEKDSVVKSISVFNRGEMESWWLRNYEIRVGYDTISNTDRGKIFDGNKLCGSLNDSCSGKGWLHVECRNPLTGHYLSIQITQFCTGSFCLEPLTNILTLCEIHVWGYTNEEKSPGLKDVAIRQPAMQSLPHFFSYSSFRNGTFVQDIGEYLPKEFLPDQFPWWRVDLQGTFMINLVSILNRATSTAGDLYVMDIRIGNEDIAAFKKDEMFLNNLRCSNIRGDKLYAGRMDYQCETNITGRFISLQVDRTSTQVFVVPMLEIVAWSSSTWSITEVENNKTINLDNLALFKSAAESTYVSSSYLAVNGENSNIPLINYLTSKCAVTQREIYPWWRVNLGDIHMVEKVTIAFKAVSFEEGKKPYLDIRVGCTDATDMSSRERFKNNLLCQTNVTELSTDKIQLVKCEIPRRGRYVSLQLLQNCMLENGCWPGPSRLVLCVFEVFGKPLLDYLMKLNETLVE